MHVVERLEIGIGIYMRLVFTRPRPLPSTDVFLITWKKKGLSDLKASAEASALPSASLIAD